MKASLITSPAIFVAPLMAASFTLTAHTAPLARNTNQSRATRSVIAGGTGNLIMSNEPAPQLPKAAFIGAGTNNTIGKTAGYAAIVGGFKNTANGFDAAIGGGYRNEAAGGFASIPGGYENKANGTYSFAAGASAEATHLNAFVWGGGGDADGFNKKTTSIGANSFTVRAPGGFKFYTTRDDVTGPSLAPGDASWAVPSDSNLKTGVTAVDHRATLAQLAQMPVTAWKYKGNPARSFVGPMAQDFHSAFGLGSDDKVIGTIDADGVLFSAMKGLIEELKARDTRIDELEVQNGEMRESIKQLNERLDKLPPAQSH